MMPHDCRVLAINPKVGKIRAFASYDNLQPFHNESAKLSLDYSPEKRALKWYSKACVVENMTAQNP